MPPAVHGGLFTANVISRVICLYVGAVPFRRKAPAISKRLLGGCGQVEALTLWLYLRLRKGQQTSGHSLVAVGLQGGATVKGF